MEFEVNKISRPDVCHKMLRSVEFCKAGESQAAFLANLLQRTDLIVESGGWDS